MAKFRQGNLVLTATQEIIQGDNTTILDANGVLANLATLQLNLGATINEFSIDGTLVGNSDTAVPTEKAVKLYVDTQITAEDLDFAGDSGTGAVDLNSQSLTIAGGTGLTSVAGSQTITINIDSTVATLTGGQILTNKTLTSPVFNTGVSGTAVSTDGTLAANLDTLLVSQKAIRTYVAAQITAEDLDFAGDSGTGSVDLNSQSLTITGGTGLTSVAGSQTITLNIDSTVTTLTGSQVLTNKTLTSPIINTILAKTAETGIAIAADGAVDLYYDGAVVAQTTAAGITGAVWG